MNEQEAEQYQRKGDEQFLKMTIVGEKIALVFPTEVKALTIDIDNATELANDLLQSVAEITGEAVKVSVSRLPAEQAKKILRAKIDRDIKSIITSIFGEPVESKDKGDERGKSD